MRPQGVRSTNSGTGAAAIARSAAAAASASIAASSGAVAALAAFDDTPEGELAPGINGGATPVHEGAQVVGLVDTP